MVTDAEIEAVWTPLFYAGAAIAGALLAGLAAGQNENRWWTWVPIGALLPFAPAGIVHALEASPFVDTAWTHARWFIASASCAAWSGYIAWTKERSVWLWGVLSAVFLYIPLVIVAFRPSASDSSLERTVSAPGRPRAVRASWRPRPAKAPRDLYEQWFASARGRLANVPPGGSESGCDSELPRPGSRTPRPTRATDPLSAFLSRERTPGDNRTDDS